ncbi:DUF2306 domain-containing protein [Bacillus sp. FJAT-29814]|uniref:DUF2306 domain-containing protein n=1 Tax=Bacillus sp. FJAT-29814 TaxID=1729688 RepID=UPI0008332080|nr:DUF2306 domain-containing protein [Bacillus sp. FJAT-29814]
MVKQKINWKLWLGYFIIIAFMGYIVFMYGINDPRKAGIVAGKLENPSFPFDTWKLFFYFHIATGAIALILGPFQFLKKSRKKIKTHRAIGKIYVGSIFLSVPAGIYLAFYATGGIGSTIAFLILDVAWFVTTFIGMKRIKERNIQSHQEWMMRSYAVTLVFVTFRILVGLFVFLFGFAVGFPVTVILSIIINLYFIERYLKKIRRGVVNITPTIVKA